MAAQGAAGAVHHPAGTVVGRRLPLDESGVVAIRNEADLLALGLVRRGKLPLRCEAPYVLLGQAADREDRRRELLLREAEQEVRLVLASVESPQEPLTARGGIVVLARVVSGRDVLDAEGSRARQQALELDLGIAPRARQGSAPLEIVADEGGDHSVLERALEVDDVVGDP